MYPPIHRKPKEVFSFERLDMLWEKYPNHHEMATYIGLDEPVEEHESYKKDFDEELKSEYLEKHYDRFLIRLSWDDLPYHYETRRLIESAQGLKTNIYVDHFMSQFQNADTDHKAYFLFPESFVSQFFVVSEVCKGAERFYPTKSLFPDEEKVHYLAVFDKENMDDILMMYHLLYIGGIRMCLEVILFTIILSPGIRAT